MIRWTQKRLDDLFYCWITGKNNKERMELIKEKLTVAPFVAFNKMRELAKTDEKWLNHIEQKNKDVEQKNKIIEIKRLKRKEKLNEEKLIGWVKNNLKFYHKDELDINKNFFYCSDIHQYTNELFCIFRTLCYDYGDSGPICNKCIKMYKHLRSIKNALNFQIEGNDDE
jgi:hypothetical protein